MKAIENHQGFRLRFGEFPDLLFTVTDARTYFDMTHFLQSMKLEPEEKHICFLKSNIRKLMILPIIIT